MTNKPEITFRAGGISAAVWLNTRQMKGQSVQDRTVVIKRSYKDNKNEWKNSNSLRANDLPKAAICINKAYEYLVTKSEETSGNKAITE